MRYLLVVFSLPAMLALTWQPSIATTSPGKADVKLAVLLVFDQFRGDYTARWRSLYGADGIRRLIGEGAWYRNCHYPYSDTFTAAGHASLLTGCSPNEHGIINNEWYDRHSGEEVYAGAVGRYERVPIRLAPPAASSSTDKKKTKFYYNISPERMRVDSLGDSFKRAVGNKGKVVALSHKDRSAILPAGRGRDRICFWYDHETGEFITSTYYREKAPPWVVDFNRGKPADAWFNKPWDHFVPGLEYRAYSGPDDVMAEGKLYGQGRTFPHPMNGGLKQPGRAYYDALFTSPQGNELLLAFAKEAILAEKLGQGEAKDLLILSFSCNDAIGHCYGPDSQEVLDCTLRTDALIADLLHYLDRTIGKNRYFLTLTADHGVCPLPEVASVAGRDAARVPTETLSVWAQEHLDRVFGKIGDRSKWIEAKSSMHLYLNQRLLQARGIPATEAEAALAKWLERQPGIEHAFTRTKIMAADSSSGLMLRKVALSFDPARSGDVVVILKPYHLLGPKVTTGTTHGSPHEYDTHVPLIAFGPGIRGGVFDEPITPQAVCAILARSLNVPMPPAARADAPKGLFVEVLP